MKGAKKGEYQSSEDTSDYDSLGEHQADMDGSQGLGISASFLLDRYFNEQEAPELILEEDSGFRHPGKSKSPKIEHSSVNPDKASKYDEKLYRFVSDLELAKYMSIFLKEEIHYDDLPTLSMEDFREMGLPIGPRKRLVSAIEKEWKTEGGLLTVTSSPAEARRGAPGGGEGGSDKKVSFNNNAQTIAAASERLSKVQKKDDDKKDENRKRSGTVAFYEQMSQGAVKQVQLLGTEGGDLNDEDDDDDDKDSEDEDEDDSQEEEEEEDREEKVKTASPKAKPKAKDTEIKASIPEPKKKVEIAEPGSGITKAAGEGNKKSGIAKDAGKKVPEAAPEKAPKKKKKIVNQKMNHPMKKKQQ